jgi:O-phosphoseryl-tRNA(Cys) synthetase
MLTPSLLVLAAACNGQEPSVEDAPAATPTRPEPSRLEAWEANVGGKRNRYLALVGEINEKLAAPASVDLGVSVCREMYAMAQDDELVAFVKHEGAAAGIELTTEESVAFVDVVIDVICPDLAR